MERLTAQKLEASLFTTSNPDAKLHFCVVPIDERFAATFKHGPHFMYKEGENHLDVVRTISDEYDIIVFDLVDQKFPFYPNGSNSMFREQSFKQLGINQQREPTWKEGTVSEEYYGSFVGTSHGRSGDPGSGIFDLWGRFLGISVAKKDFTFDVQENMPIAEVANHHPDTKIIDSRTIFAISKIVGTDPFLPQQKK